MNARHAPAVRVGRRAVEGLRIDLARTSEIIAALEAEASTLDARIAAESAAAARDGTATLHPWLRTQRERLDALAERHAATEQALGRLREEMAEALGRLHALERAAEAEAERARQAAVRRAQAESDDLTNARRLAARRRQAP